MAADRETGQTISDFFWGNADCPNPQRVAGKCATEKADIIRSGERSASWDNSRSKNSSGLAVKL